MKAVNGVEMVHLVIVLVSHEFHLLAMRVFNETMIRLGTIAHDNRTFIDTVFKGKRDIRRTGTCPIDAFGDYMVFTVGGYTSTELHLRNPAFTCVLSVPAGLYACRFMPF